MIVEDGNEFGQWNPTVSEMAELLHHLQLSPPHSDEELMSQPENSTTSRSDQSESDESTCTTVTLEKFNRSEMLEQLENTINEKGMNRMKNNWFHEHLVEHFTRKQMIHVCSDKYEEPTTLDEYLCKLKLLDKQNIKTLSSEGRWNEELSAIRMEIAVENKKAEELVQSIIVTQQEIRICFAPHAKLLALRKIDNLLSRQIGRINKVSHFRLSYLKIRNKLILIENNLHSIISTMPNLSKDDYERLVAEQCYYKQQLNCKIHHRIGLMSRKDYSVHKLETFNSKISHIENLIKSKNKRICNLRKIMEYHLHYNRNLLKKMNKNNRMIHNFRNEIHISNVGATHREYEEWMEKISVLLKEIKRLGQSLSALKTNLILHGKNIESVTNDNIEILEKKQVDKPLWDGKYTPNRNDV